jgi:hypothetical protein
LANNATNNRQQRALVALPFLITPALNVLNVRFFKRLYSPVYD